MKYVVLILTIFLFCSINTFGKAHPDLLDTIKTLKAKIETLEQSNKQLQKQNNELLKELQSEKSAPTNKSWWERFHAVPRYSFIGLSAVALLLILWYFWRKNKYGIKKTVYSTTNQEKVIHASPQPQLNIPMQIPIATFQQSIVQPTRKVIQQDENNVPKSFSNIQYRQPRTEKENWLVVGASSIGKSHLSSKLPCQDNHFCGNLKNGWGIAVSCDGAGSAKNSDKGSVFIVEKAFRIFQNFLQENGFIDANRLPTQQEWQEMSKHAFEQVYNALIEFAKNEQIVFNSLACTAIVVVFTPMGLLYTAS